MYYSYGIYINYYLSGGNDILVSYVGFYLFFDKKKSSH